MTRQPRETTKEETKELVVRLPSNLHAEVKQRAEQEDRSMASTIRQALKLYLRTGTPAM